MDWLDYFQGYEGYFWRWEEDGEVLAVPGGSTIAYKAFVTEVLEHLSSQGFPPFGALLLCIIATNPGGESALNEVYALMDAKLGGGNSTREPLKSAISFLLLLAQLPKKYKQGRNRFLVLQTLFANTHRGVGEKKAKKMLDAFLEHQQAQNVWLATKSFHVNAYNNDFRAVSLLAGKFPDVETIISGLADLPAVQELILEEPLSEQGDKKDFIRELINHSQTFHVGSLIKSLWSGLQIPYHHHLPSQHPVGGISDLTNRGGFDRLLLSEFANDELLFLSRLANGEALYVNREMPPQQNRQERVMLIDVSIKSWGTPKILAYALLLAIARHPKTAISCSAFAVGKECHPVAFHSIEEVITSLQVLEPCLHPALGLEAFFNRKDVAKDREIFFIAAKEVFDQPQLCKTLSDHKEAFNYLIQTDNKGNMDVYRRQQRSQKHVQHIHLDLDEHWKKEPKKPAAGADKKHEKRPVYPILFPAVSNAKKILPADDGTLFAITAEGALLRSTNHQSVHVKGWEMVYENLPYPNAEAEIGQKKNGEYLLLLFNVSNSKVIILNLATGKGGSIHFNDSRKSEYKNFIFYNGRFTYCSLGYTSKHWLFELEEHGGPEQWGTIVVESIENLPSTMIDYYKNREKKLKEVQYKKWDKSVLKNVTAVFINQVNNLVFNNAHELRLTDHSIIKLERTHFLDGRLVATAHGKDEFCFPDGSAITINRAGMLILKSSNPLIDTIYIPSVLDADLSAATEHDIAGNYYYYPEGAARKDPISRVQFWKRYMEPFIDTIVKHGTTAKTLS
ncbi:MAG: hypothetical protein INR73_23440 [Williamsia sp.]|nr:hypothetical protein [Williamsia sp.]